MAAPQDREGKSSVSFWWDEEKYDSFKLALSRLKAEEEIDQDTTNSEAIRAVLEEWLENPDPSTLNE
ncbi:MAG: hypothetical protein ABEJ73_12355 [Haloplanus sp.]